MVQANRDEPLVPTFSVALSPPSVATPDDEVAAEDVLQWIQSVSVHDQVDNPSTFELQLTDQDEVDGGRRWADDGRFVLGANVAVSLGYGGDLELMIAGEITELAPGFSVGGLPTLTVHGADLRHRLRTVPRTRPVAGRKLSELAKKICEAQNIEIEVVDSVVTADRDIVQVRQTDLAFLKKCADRLHYELVMKGRKLRFGPVETRAARVATLTLDDDLLEFNPVLSLLPLTGIELRGYDVETKAPITARAGADTAVGMGGTQSAAEATGRVFGELIEVLSSIVVGGQAELDQLARAKWDAAALEHVSGGGRSRGRTDVRAGVIIGIAGLGKRFSGDYRVESAAHSYQRGGEYVTTFQVRRNAS
jgi:phage protein D